MRNWNVLFVLLFGIKAFSFTPKYEGILIGIPRNAQEKGIFVKTKEIEISTVAGTIKMSTRSEDVFRKIQNRKNLAPVVIHYSVPSFWNFGFEQTRVWITKITQVQNKAKQIEDIILDSEIQSDLREVQIYPVETLWKRNDQSFCKYSFLHNKKMYFVQLDSLNCHKAYESVLSGNCSAKLTYEHSVTAYLTNLKDEFEWRFPVQKISNFSCR